MNRPYTYNRDKGKCKICGGYIEPNEARFHHVDKKLPMNQMNKSEEFNHSSPILSRFNS